MSYSQKDVGIKSSYPVLKKAIQKANFNMVRSGVNGLPKDMKYQILKPKFNKNYLRPKRFGNK